MTICSIALIAVATVPSAAMGDFQVEETTIASIQRALQAKEVTCHEIVQAYLDRIAAYDHKGPALAAILAPNPKALAQQWLVLAGYF